MHLMQWYFAPTTPSQFWDHTPNCQRGGRKRERTPKGWFTTPMFEILKNSHSLVWCRFWSLLWHECPPRRLSGLPLSTSFCRGWGKTYSIDGQVHCYSVFDFSLSRVISGVSKLSRGFTCHSQVEGVLYFPATEHHCTVTSRLPDCTAWWQRHVCAFIPLSVVYKVHLDGIICRFNNSILKTFWQTLPAWSILEKCTVGWMPGNHSAHKNIMHK